MPGLGGQVGGAVQPGFTITSSPIVKDTVVPTTILKEIKITLRNKPLRTTLTSTSTVSTQACTNCHLFEWFRQLVIDSFWVEWSEPDIEQLDKKWIHIQQKTTFYPLPIDYQLGDQDRSCLQCGANRRSPKPIWGPWWQPLSSPAGLSDPLPTNQWISTRFANYHVFETICCFRRKRKFLSAYVTSKKDRRTKRKNNFNLINWNGRANWWLQ